MQSNKPAHYICLMMRYAFLARKKELKHRASWSFLSLVLLSFTLQFLSFWVVGNSPKRLSEDTHLRSKTTHHSSFTVNPWALEGQESLEFDSEDSEEASQAHLLATCCQSFNPKQESLKSHKKWLLTHKKSPPLFLLFKQWKYHFLES